MTVAYLFPGQGSHAVGMGQAVAEADPDAAALFDQANDILGFDLKALCFNGPLEELTLTHNQQPALLVTSIATLTALRKTDAPAPDFVAGHSLGEFSALVAAEAISFEDGVKLVRLRGEAMTRAGEKEPGGMAAILGLSAEQVADICGRASEATGQYVQVANDNCPGQIVISGQPEALEKAQALLSEAGAKKVVKLGVSIAAHSSAMRFAAEELATAIDNVAFSAPSVPVIGNTSAEPLTTPEAIKAELNAQLTGNVRWTESMQYLVGQGVDTVYEVGSGDVLRKLMKRIDRKVARKGYE